MKMLDWLVLVISIMVFIGSIFWAAMDRKGEVRVEIASSGDIFPSFPLREISSVNIFKQQKFEFRYRRTQYRLQPPNRSISGYKWEKAFKGLRKLLVERGEW